MQAILFLLLTALFSSHDARIVFDEPSPIVSSSLGETLMAIPAKEGMYRFSAYIEMQSGKGCESDTTLYFVRDYVGPGVVSVGKTSEIKIRKNGSADAAEIPATMFRVKAGTHIGYSVSYMIGGQCKTRPTYKVFPLLESVGK